MTGARLPVGCSVAVDDEERIRRELQRDVTRGVDTERARNAALSSLFGLEQAPVEVGRYRLGDRIGAGGMGTVYEGFDPDLDRQVAIKILDRLPAAVEGEPTDASRILDEARALGRLSHPNIAELYDAGESRGRVYLVMELVRGKNLRQWLASAGSPPPQTVLRLLGAAGKGLQAVHEAKLVHGDFKPDNVLVGDDGAVKVVELWPGAFGRGRLVAGGAGRVRQPRGERWPTWRPSVSPAARRRLEAISSALACRCSKPWSATARSPDGRASSSSRRHCAVRSTWQVPRSLGPSRACSNAC